MFQDGRLRSGDHILQIGDVNVRGMGSDQVAMVLRQSGVHVRLIVARGVAEVTENAPLHAPIIPTQQLDEHLHYINESLMALEHDHLQHHYDMLAGDAIQAAAAGATTQYMAQVHSVRLLPYLTLLPAYCVTQYSQLLSVQEKGLKQISFRFVSHGTFVPPALQ